MSITRKTIAVDKKIHDEVKTLSKTLDLDLGEFVKQSMLYFKKTGINPGKSDHESPLKAMEELNKRVGQVVAFMKAFEKDRLNPLHDGLILLKNTLGDSLKILPKSERFEQVVKNIVDHSNLLEDHHVKRMASLQESQQEIMQENKSELGSLASAIRLLTESVNGLKAEQEAIKEAIETKLGKKINLNPFQSA